MITQEWSRKLSVPYCGWVMFDILRDKVCLKSANIARTFAKILADTADKMHPQSAGLKRLRHLHTTRFHIASAAGSAAAGTKHVYFTVGANFIQTADISLEDNGPTGPTYFLLGHGIEILLKSYLLHIGSHTEQQLKNRPFQHDLIMLLDACKSNGMIVDPQHEAILRLYAPFFSDFTFRYGFNRPRIGSSQQTIDIPHQERLLEAAEQIMGIVARLI